MDNLKSLEDFTAAKALDTYLYACEVNKWIYEQL